MGDVDQEEREGLAEITLNQDMEQPRKAGWESEVELCEGRGCSRD